ncbi:MAG: apolipoprotein N-acyltransferase, partial [Proteobacteria bacterium]|nr:apolipoprotein N-acyltransferase [Pseudomonadota bacterium]
PSFQPLICYEAIFPNLTPDDGGTQAQWLLNVTNDAWFGRSSGPYQHFQMARTRAVERGLPLVRAANTGISAVVDSLGRVTAQLGLGETGVLDAALPAAIPAGTPYSSYGERIVIAIAILLAAASVLIRHFDQTIRKFRKR